MLASPVYVVLAKMAQTDPLGLELRRLDLKDG